MLGFGEEEAHSFSHCIVGCSVFSLPAHLVSRHQDTSYVRRTLSIRIFIAQKRPTAETASHGDDVSSKQKKKLKMEIDISLPRLNYAPCRLQQTP